MDKIRFIPSDELIPEYVMGAMSEIQDWGLLMMGVPEAHKHTRGRGVRVAVLDTGAAEHLDLEGNVETAWNTSGSDTAIDRAGHGTHVSGIVAALSNGFGVVGVAPEATIVPIKVLDDSGHSGFSAIERGIRKATELGVDIINMSLGSPVSPPGSLYQAIQEAASRGIIIVAAAGNDAGAINYPAIYPEVIAVGAIDKQGHLAKTSSRGEKMHIVAPGVDIYSTYLENRYALLSGTSQAAPVISGLCALIIAWTRITPGVRPVQDVQDMLKRLDDMSDNDGRVTLPDGEHKISFGVPRFLNDMPWLL